MRAFVKYFIDKIVIGDPLFLVCVIQIILALGLFTSLIVSCAIPMIIN
jgi:hypothetical protein